MFSLNRKSPTLSSHGSQIRPYYAATTKNVTRVESRLTQRKDGIALEILEPNKYKYFMQYHESYHSFPGLLSRLSSIFFKMRRTIGWYESSTWSKTFSIGSDGKIEANRHQILSTTFFDFLMSCNEREILACLPDQKEYLPDILYGIPQEIWNDFIAKLPSQKVVTNLNLAEHRHLWAAYNYAVSTADANIQHLRSDAMGKYHFLISLTPNYTPYYGGYFLYDIVGNISDYKVTVQFFDIDLNAKQILKMIDDGKAPSDILKNRMPWLTPLLISKFSYCPTWRDMNFIGSYLIWPKVERAINGKEKLDEYVAALPSSKKSPDLFAEMIQLSRHPVGNFRYLKESGLDAHLFYQARNQFSLFKKHQDISEQISLQDYLNALNRDLIFPYLIRQLQASPNGLKKFISGVGLSLAIYRINNKLINELAVLLIEYNYNQLFSLQKRWHRNVTVIESKKPLPVFLRQWHPLFETQTINNVTFSCISNDIQLRIEGLEMQHCVGGYASNCLHNYSHIFSIKTSAGERATLELIMEKHNKEHIKIFQLSGVRNTPIEKGEIKNAVNQLVKQIKNNQISLNPQCGKITSHDQDGRTEAHDIYPYSFQDERIQEEIYQTYAHAKVLPSLMSANSYNEMLEKSGIQEFIKNSIIPEILQDKAEKPYHHEVKLV